MKKEKDSRIKGIIGTILFHAGLIALFIFLGLSTPLPLPGEEGVEVNLGYTDQGMGNDQQPQPAPAEEDTPPPQPVEEPEEEIITQESEEAPVIEKPEIIEKKPEPELKPVEEVPEKKPEEKPVEQPQVDQRAIYKGKSTNTEEGGQEGQTGEAGDQGDPDGDPNATDYDGQGGKGDGPGFDLGGRGAKNLPSPSYNSNDQGNVVVEIFVDREGNVISARAGVKGTTINDARLWDVARDAAMRSRFMADPNAPERQRGTITYKFRRTGG
jgi:outer membrane biosynthesis protein TonB